MTRLAIDLGGTSLRLALGDGRSEWRHHHQLARPEGDSADSIIAAISATLRQWDVGPAELSGIGVSVAGLVDPGGMVRRAENLGWTDVPLGAALARAFDRPVSVDTDVFCGARFEATAGQARGAPAALYVALGTGIGHAVVLDGRVWRGSHGNANGFGHITVTPDGPPCYCGNAGCLCLLAGGREQAAANPPPGALEALARALGGATTLIEPAIIVLSGGALAQPWFDLPALTSALATTCYPGVKLPAVRVSDVADPNLRGAALMLEDT